MQNVLDKTHVGFNENTWNTALFLKLYNSTVYFLLK